MRSKKPPEPTIVIRSDEVILPKLAFRVDELVNVLGLGKTKIRELIDRGQLGHIKEGSAVLVTSRHVEAYLEAREARCLVERRKT